MADVKMGLVREDTMLVALRGLAEEKPLSEWTPLTLSARLSPLVEMMVEAAVANATHSTVQVDFKLLSACLGMMAASAKHEAGIKSKLYPCDEDAPDIVAAKVKAGLLEALERIVKMSVRTQPLAAGA